MATVKFDLVSPERKLASENVDSVEIPASEGDFTVMVEHAPMLTTLRPGILRINDGSNLREYIVTGGFVEVFENSVSVLAEQAILRSDITRETIDELIEDAVKSGENLAGLAKDIADKRIAEMNKLIELL